MAVTRRTRSDQVNVEIPEKTRRKLQAIVEDWQEVSGETITRGGVIRTLIIQEFRRRKLKLDDE